MDAWRLTCCSVAADVTLAQRLQEELTYEKESGSEVLPDFVKEFKQQGIWEVNSSHIRLVGLLLMFSFWM